ncbi:MULTISPECIES: hypothetical protein [unclassified Moorena]|uniref:hypothetical protein n=1 Tax=unclassified Moorena TaxID=2683338 RepID=UPI0013FFE70F|nr:MULTISPECIES: hypothetical protein [unclassified Moorena]NEO16500.1 hypothetical protein [Moorena sp. SIO3E8]NEQ03027.1 hypothetical protein [Moorena sp. SIO3F7]
MKDSKDFYEGIGLTLLDPQNETEGVREYQKLEEEFIKRTFEGVDSVLEVGCGEGRYLRRKHSGVEIDKVTPLTSKAESETIRENAA